MPIVACSALRPQGHWRTLLCIVCLMLEIPDPHVLPVDFLNSQKKTVPPENENT